jgi:dolichol-phosphate mannosyltransferase
VIVIMIMAMVMVVSLIVVVPAASLVLAVPVPVVVHGDQDKSIGFTRPDVLHAWSIICARMKLSVVIPVCNEADNVGPLAREIQAALVDHQPFEIIFIDDGSTDGTVAAVKAAHAGGIPEIRLLEHSQRCGQSRAVCTGVEAARAEWVATLDGDGQNDPADIPELVKAVMAGDDSLRLIMGNRTTRKDTWLRRISSRVANRVRGGLLRDGTPDTGCGIKLMHRATFMRLPWFNHMHRFLPALYQRAGARVVSVPVRHRPRTRGVSKYGLSNRLWVGIVDLFGVRWLILRNSPPIRIRESLPRE